MLPYPLNGTVCVVAQRIDADGAKVTPSGESLVVVEGIPVALVFYDGAMARVATGRFEIYALVFPIRA